MIVKSNKSGLLGVGGLILRPGVNQLGEEQAAAWKTLAKNPEVKKLIEDGDLEVSGALKAGDDEDGPSDDGGTHKDADALKALKPQQAQDMVKSCADEALLLQWAQSEKRPSVKKAIEEQLAEVRKAPEFRNEKKSEDGNSEDKKD